MELSDIRLYVNIVFKIIVTQMKFETILSPHLSHFINMPALAHMAWEQKFHGMNSI